MYSIFLLFLYFYSTTSFFPKNPFKLIEPTLRWFPGNDALGDKGREKLLPPLVNNIRKDVFNWRKEFLINDIDKIGDFVHVSYDSPYKFYNRRNEVIIKVKY